MLWGTESVFPAQHEEPSGAADPIAAEGQSSAESWAGCSASASATAMELRYNPQYMTESELATHQGLRPDSMLLLALKSSTSAQATILDVSEGALDYYGPGAPYHVFTGRDCSRAFSLTTLKPEHLHADMTDATREEWAVLDDWAEKLSAKYPVVGTLIPEAKPANPQTDRLARQEDDEEDEWRMVGPVVKGPL